MDKNFGRAPGTRPMPLTKKRSVGKPATILPDLIDRANIVKSARREFARPNFMPTDAVELEELGYELIHWSTQDEALSIDDFFSAKRMSPKRFLRICEDNATLDYCLDVALANIAKRLERALHDNQMYAMSKIKHYSIMPIEEARKKRDADQDRRVITT